MKEYEWVLISHLKKGVCSQQRTKVQKTATQNQNKTIKRKYATHKLKGFKEFGTKEEENVKEKI